MAATRPLLLRGATLIDGFSRKPRENVAILVRNGRITAVGAPDEIGLPDGAEVLDLAGKWVIPGLIEMHCHIKDVSAPFFVAAGITTVRNTAGWLNELADLRSAPAGAPTPRVISAGRIIDGPPGLWGGTSPGNLITDGPEEARAEVRRQAAEGADLIKVYGLLTLPVMRAVVEEAASLGLTVSCDMSYQKHATIRDAARLGIRWNEHATGFAQALFPGWKLSWKDEDWGTAWHDGDSPELDRLCEEVAASGLILCPTLTLWDQAGRLPDYWWPDHPVAQALNTVPEFTEHFAALAPASVQPGARRMSLHTQAVARAYRRAGGIVVAGTDTPALAWNGSGIALHRELQLLVQNGWSPLEALWAATSTAAQTLGRNDLGVIRPGAVADLVILNGNPLADIANTLLTDRVVKGGAVYTPETAMGTGPDFPALQQKMERLMAEYQAAQGT